VDRNARRLGFIALAAAVALSACSSPSAVPAPGPRSVMMRFPSRAAYGVAAHYRVYRTDVPGRPARLVALQVQTPASYLAALGASPVPYARIRYPDGSVQRADAEGTFDAAASVYAQRHPQRAGQPNAPVRLSASVAGAQLAGSAAVFTPAAGREAAMPSGAIESGALSPTLGVAPAYAFSCDPTKFMHKAVVDVSAGTSWTSAEFQANASYSYFPLFGFCGVENSFLNDTYVTATRYWKDKQTIQVYPDTVPGCFQDPGGPLLRSHKTAFDCTVQTWYTVATFNSSQPWANNNDVALWFEAWQFHIFREHFADAHLELLKVR
jgi:hypothetical protein